MAFAPAAKAHHDQLTAGASRRLKTDYIDLYQVRRPSPTTDEILDRIDELVAPGVTLNADDNSYGAPEFTSQA